MGNNKVLTALVIAHDYPELPAGLIAEGLDKLYRLAKKSQRQAVDYSNGYIDSEEDERLDEKMRLSLDKVNKEYFEGRLVFFQQGDPRGPVLGLLLPSKRYNSWDGESWRFITD
jgi:hypothetical protein